MAKTRGGEKKVKKYERKGKAKGIVFARDLEQIIEKNRVDGQRSFSAEVVYGYRKYLKSIGVTV